MRSNQQAVKGSLCRLRETPAACKRASKRVKLPCEIRQQQNGDCQHSIRPVMLPQLAVPKLATDWVPTIKAWQAGRLLYGVAPAPLPRSFSNELACHYHVLSRRHKFSALERRILSNALGPYLPLLLAILIWSGTRTIWLRHTQPPVSTPSRRFWQSLLVLNFGIRAVASAGLGLMRVSSSATNWAPLISNFAGDFCRPQCWL